MPMKLLLSFICCLTFGNVQAQVKPKVTYDRIVPAAHYNFVLGTNSIGGNYQFSEDSKLLEQAKHIRGMGSNILKISLGANSPKAYGLTTDKNVATTLQLFNASPEYKKVFDMDFKYLFVWVHTLSGIEWKKGINEAQEKVLYNEMFEFASYILNEYKNTGKTFLIGNWEGDWLLHTNNDRNMNPSQEHINNMTKWFQIRQKAIDDAKKKAGNNNVFLYYYVEVNLVLKGMKGQNCISKDILSKVNPDLVSYSSYEAIKNRTFDEKKTQLKSVFEYIESQLQPKESMPFSRRVYIGEYGYQANINKPESFAKQYLETRDIMAISLELNLPFSLHWQMYNNEYDKTDGVSKEMSLINERGEKTPVYKLHQYYYKQMNRYLKKYKKKKKEYPSDADFRKKAVDVLMAVDFSKNN
jgi:hypothetical protein